jgi:mannose-1-phosphate guanylyltransferase
VNANAGFERWIVVLAGGIGSRFWPASTPGRPKQFLPLASGRPLIVDTLDRAHAVAPPENVLIVAGEHLRPHIERQLPELPPEQLLCEPQARGTAPALAWAAQEILTRSQRPEQAVMVSLHSDHVVRPLDQFVSTLERAVEGAGALDRLLTVGIAPSRPETGYGYIEVGSLLSPDVFEIRRFVEKPDRATAEAYLARGGFLWNSGMFVWRPQLLLAELAAHTPELAGELERLRDGDIEGFFAAVPTLTIDNGLMERSRNSAVVQAEFDWDDVGAWAALMRVRELDGEGNLLVGDAHAIECRDSLVWAEDGPVVAFGFSDIVVVRASGITFVTPRDRSADLKKLLAELPDDLKKGVE